MSALGQHRTYRRRRLFSLLLAAGLGALASGALASGLSGHFMASASTTRTSGPACAPMSRSPASTCGTITYVARPGDTVWAVAVRFSGDGDPRPLEYRLEAQIGGGVLQPGEVLHVP